MAPEEEPPLVVGERDALTGHLEVHNGGRGQWPRREQLLHGAPDGLRARQRLGVRREQVQHVASCKHTRQMVTPVILITWETFNAEQVEWRITRIALFSGRKN